MQIYLHSMHIAKPTQDTITEYTENKFSKLLSLSRFPSNDGTIHLQVEFNKHSKLFNLKVVFIIGNKPYIFARAGEDVRKLIELAAGSLRKQILKSRGKSWLNYHH